MIVIQAAASNNNDTAANALNYADFQDSVPKNGSTQKKNPLFSDSETVSPRFKDIDPETYKGDPFYQGRMGRVVIASSDNGQPSNDNRNQNLIEWDYPGGLENTVRPNLNVAIGGDPTEDVANYFGYSLSPGEEGTYFRVSGGGIIYKNDGKTLSIVKSLPKHLWNSNESDLDNSPAAPAQPDPSTQGFATGINSPSDKMVLDSTKAGLFVKVTTPKGQETQYNVQEIKGLGTKGYFISVKPYKPDGTYKVFIINGSDARSSDMPKANGEALLKMTMHK